MPQTSGAHLSNTNSLLNISGFKQQGITRKNQHQCISKVVGTTLKELPKAKSQNTLNNKISNYSIGYNPLKQHKYP